MSGRILAVDLGLKHTGLAVSDELRISTRVLPALTPKSRAEDIAHILKLCDDLEVQVLLIGYPLLPQSGEEGFMAKRARGFVEALKQQAPAHLGIFLVDESYSSKEAELRTGQNKNLDGESARILIETFIHAQNH